MRIFAGPRWPMLALVPGFVLLSLIYIYFTPPFEGPDEAQHFAYVTWLAQGRGFPPQGEASWDTPVEQEASQPPLYYLLASLPARYIDLDNPPATYWPNPHFATLLSPNAGDNDNRAIHTPGEADSLAGGWLALYLSRLLTVAFGALLVVAVYGLARSMVPKAPAVAWAAAILVATIPQLLFLSSVVSNDVPAAALATVTLWLLARLLRGGPGRRKALALGIAFGLALLTKVSTFTLLLPLALGIGWLWFSGRYELRATITTALWTAFGAFAVSGWWFLRSWLLYGSPLGLETHDATPWAIRDPATLQVPAARWLDTIRSFWIAFGWGTIRPDGWVYAVLFVLMAIAGIGLVLATWQGWRKRGRRLDTGAVLLLLLALALFAVTVALEVWMQRVKAAHGRLLFPAIGALAILLVLGWRSVHPRLPFLATGFVASLGLLAPFLLLAPAFAPPTLLSPVEVEMLPESLNWRFGPSPATPVAELLSVTPATETISAGAVLPVRVCWRALGETSTDYTVLLHVIGPENRVVAARRSYPGMGTYPTSLWQEGIAFCDQMRVEIVEERVPQTMRYRLEIALIDEALEKRLPAYSVTGDALAATFVDEIVVRTARDSSVAPDGAEPFQLLAQDLPRLWQPGQEYSIMLRWGVGTPVQADYQIFVHLRDPESGENVAQADGPPLDGWYPTSWWTDGEIVEEERRFQVPADLRRGHYRLVVGFYELETGQRVGPEHDLGLVTVRP